MEENNAKEVNAKSIENLISNINEFNHDSTDEFVDAPADPRPVAKRNSATNEEPSPHLASQESKGNIMNSDRAIMETPEQNDRMRKAQLAEVNSRTLILKKNSRPGLPEAMANVSDKSSATDTTADNKTIQVESTSLENNRYHVRRETVTVESSSLADIEKIFDEIHEMKDLQDPMAELKRRMNALFISKENEYNSKLIETENRLRADLNMANLKLCAAMEVSSKAEKFLDLCKQRGIDLKAVVTPDGSASNTTIQSSLNARRSPQEQQTIQLLIRERDSLRDDLNSLENNYSELFKRYEKMRENCTNLKTNEEALKERLEGLAKTKEEIVQRYYELRDHAHDQLNRANNEISRLIKQHDEDTLALRLGLKQKEAQVASLQSTLDSKTRENAELAQICEELIKKSEMMDSRSD